MTENISKLRIEGGTPLVGAGAQGDGRSTAWFDPLDPA